MEKRINLVPKGTYASKRVELSIGQNIEFVRISQTFPQLSKYRYGIIQGSQHIYISYIYMYIQCKVKTSVTVLSSCLQLHKCLPQDTNVQQQYTYSNRRVANHLHGLIFELKERMNSRQDRPVMPVYIYFVAILCECSTRANRVYSYSIYIFFGVEQYIRLRVTSVYPCNQVYYIGGTLIVCSINNSSSIVGFTFYAIKV